MAGEHDSICRKQFWETLITSDPSFFAWNIILGGELPTARKWVITPVVNGISRVNPLITGGYIPLTSRGMSHQVYIQMDGSWETVPCVPYPCRDAHPS